MTMARVAATVALASCLLVGVASARVFNFDVVVVKTHASAPARTRTGAVTDDAAGVGPRGLELCECEYATGSSGLECAREGAVIAGFEASGEYAGRGSDEGGLVPLSRAICCSPCAREEDRGKTVREMFPSVVDDEDGSAVFGALRTMSVDCVPTSRGASGKGATCPAGTFLQGFKRVNRASASGGRYYFYPKDGGECCKVKFVLPSGNAIGVDACDCAEEEGYDVSCGQTNEPEAVRKNGAVIGGFDSVIDAMGALGSPMRVPSTPLTCCRACVREDAEPQPLSDKCSHLNYCSSHGDCVIDGHCECHVGWTGDDCGMIDDGTNGAYGETWQYAVMLSGVILGCCMRAVLCRHVEHVNMIRAQRLMMQEPLMRRRAETTVMDEWEEASDLSTSDEEFTSDGEQAGDADADENRTATVQIARQLSDGSEDERVDNGEISSASSAEVSEDEHGEPVINKPKQRSGVPDSECAVCMTLPVQCVLIPCGHACMCRKCSRRMRRCPICRITITRRQKLYMGA
jgi:hypothetical protein